MSVYKQKGIENLSFEGVMTGIVISNYDETLEGKIKVHIPRIFYNSENTGMWVRPMNFMSKVEDKSKYGGSYRVPELKSKVLVVFLDGDPQKGYYLPVSPCIRGEKVNSINASANFFKKEYKHNVDVLRAYSNGNRIEIDNNGNDDSTYRFRYYDMNLIYFQKDSKLYSGNRWLGFDSTEDLTEFISRSNVVKIGRSKDIFVGLTMDEKSLRIDHKENTILMNEDLIRITKKDSNVNIRLEENGATIVADGGTRVDVGNDGEILIKSSTGAVITLKEGTVDIVDKSGSNIKMVSGTINCKNKSGFMRLNSGSSELGFGGNKVFISGGGIQFIGNCPQLEDLQSQINQLKSYH